MPAGRSLHLFAVVPAPEARAIRPGLRGLRHVACGPVAATIARSSERARSASQAAQRHDRILGRLLSVCSSVVPFRFGIELRSEAELRALMERNRDALCRCLARVHGRVEMGAKVKLRGWEPAAAGRLNAGLEPIRALVPHIHDRRERLRHAADGPVFEGSYLIARDGIESFWTAVDECRAALGDLPLLGSGPWAAYSFCDVLLRPGFVGQYKDGD
jgi:Gas vesicle synthesis protein GvpL/GvpF